MSEHDRFTFQRNGKTIQCLMQKQRLETGSLKGLNWSWSVHTDISPIGSSRKLRDCVFFTWKFEWDRLKEEGIIGFKGAIRTFYYDENEHVPNETVLELTESGQLVERRVEREENCRRESRRLGYDYHLYFDFDLTPLRNDIHNFPSSERTDAILVVEGVEMHVNRGFLSMHSKYFHTLFNSEFKEKSMEKISLEDVKHRDFACLLASIYPICEFLHDDNLEILLNLADRFMMRGVAHRVQNHLMTVTQLPFMKILALADKFNLDNVINHCTELIVNVQQLSDAKSSPMFAELSMPTKLKLFDTLDYLFLV